MVSLAVAHRSDLVGRRTDELDARLGADLREAGILGEEAVAGVDGVGVGDLGRRHEVGDVEVGIGAGRTADADGLVGEFDM
jgi:hypothetical protein